MLMSPVTIGKPCWRMSLFLQCLQTWSFTACAFPSHHANQ